jgi:hypothetical protein
MPTKAQEFSRLPPFQSELRKISGTPEGYIKADWGAVIVDGDTGNHYIKKSAPTLNTGWKLVTTAA